MGKILEKINTYLTVKEKKDSIRLYTEIGDDIHRIIDILNKSDDKNSIISSLSDDMKNKLNKLIEGGIINI